MMAISLHALHLNELRRSEFPPRRLKHPNFHGDLIRRPCWGGAARQSQKTLSFNGLLIRALRQRVKPNRQLWARTALLALEWAGALDQSGSI
jgi:hypothetical protein